MHARELDAMIRALAERQRGRLARRQQSRPGTSWTRCELEESFIGFLDAHGIRRGATNVHIQTSAGWFECDHVWRRERLIVELVSREHHEHDQALERDSAKRRALAAAGWRVIAITWRQLHDDPAALAAQMRVLLG